MREELEKVCIDFLENRDLAKKAFKWESSYMPPICAGILMNKQQKLTVDSLKGFRQMMKDNTGVFSDFRGHGITPMACMLAVSEDAEKLMSDALSIHKDLREHFRGSQYLALVSMIVAQIAEETEYQSIAEKMKQIYSLMKKAHPFLTSSEDGPFAALLAFSPLSAEAIVAEAEKCYQILKPDFFSSDAVQSLGHVLALGEGSAEIKCAKLKELFEGLKARDYKYGTGYELATLGALSIQSPSVAQLVQGITEVADYLEKQEGYGFFGPTKKERLVHATMLICKAYGDQSQIVNSTVITGTIAMIAAQQAALCAAVAASSAAACAAN